MYNALLTAVLAIILEKIKYILWLKKKKNLSSCYNSQILSKSVVLTHCRLANYQ